MRLPWLLEKGLIVTTENPRHKRSPLLMLNAEGHHFFGAVLEKDEETVASLFSHISKSNVHITRQTLQCLLDELNKG